MVRRILKLENCERVGRSAGWCEYAYGGLVGGGHILSAMAASYKKNYLHLFTVLESIPYYIRYMRGLQKINPPPASCTVYVRASLPGFFLYLCQSANFHSVKQ